MQKDWAITSLDAGQFLNRVRSWEFRNTRRYNKTAAAMADQSLMVRVASLRLTPPALSLMRSSISCGYGGSNLP